MIGYVDCLTGGQLNGWAFDLSDASARLVVEVYAASELIGFVPADQFRADLAAAGVGDGFHAFSFDLGSSTEAPRALRAVVRGTGYTLINKLHEREKQHMETFTQSTIMGIPRFPHAFSKSACAIDQDLAAARDIIRFCATEDLSYEMAGTAGSMWQTLIRDDQEELRNLIGEENAPRLAELLRSSPSATISNGFLQGRAAHLQLVQSSEAGREHATAHHVDSLLALAQSVGLLSLESPEQGDSGANLTSCDPTEVLSAIERRTALDLSPPDGFDDLFGAAIGGHVYTRRHFQAADALLALRQALGDVSRASVCEIGGGAGLLAFYAARHGIRRYTLIDLPGVAFQQYFMLKRCLPHKTVALGIDPLADVQIVLDKCFPDERLTGFDCVVNVDSFPEMGIDVCRTYLDLIAGKASLLLSINQENAAPLTPDRSGPRQVVVSDLLSRDRRYRPIYRFRNWVRRGYAQDLYEIARSQATGDGERLRTTYAARPGSPIRC